MCNVLYEITTAFIILFAPLSFTRLVTHVVFIASESKIITNVYIYSICNSEQYIFTSTSKSPATIGPTISGIT